MNSRPEVFKSMSPAETPFNKNIVGPSQGGALSSLEKIAQAGLTSSASKVAAEVQRIVPEVPKLEEDKSPTARTEAIITRDKYQERLDTISQEVRESTQEIRGDISESIKIQQAMLQELRELNKALQGQSISPELQTKLTQLSNNLIEAQSPQQVDVKPESSKPTRTQRQVRFIEDAVKNGTITQKEADDVLQGKSSRRPELIRYIKDKLNPPSSEPQQSTAAPETPFNEEEFLQDYYATQGQNDTAVRQESTGPTTVQPDIREGLDLADWHGHADLESRVIQRLAAAGMHDPDVARKVRDQLVQDPGMTYEKAVESLSPSASQTPDALHEYFSTPPGGEATAPAQTNQPAAESEAASPTQTTAPQEQVYVPPAETHKGITADGRFYPPVSTNLAQPEQPAPQSAAPTEVKPAGSAEVNEDQIKRFARMHPNEVTESELLEQFQSGTLSETMKNQISQGKVFAAEGVSPAKEQQATTPEGTPTTTDVADVAAVTGFARRLKGLTRSRQEAEQQAQEQAAKAANPETPPPPRPATVEDLQKALERSDKRQGKKLAAAVVGSVVLSYAIQNPDVVQNLVMHQIPEAAQYVWNTGFGARALELAKSVPDAAWLNAAGEWYSQVGPWVGAHASSFAEHAGSWLRQQGSTMGQAELQNAQAQQAGAEAMSQGVQQGVEASGRWLGAAGETGLRTLAQMRADLGSAGVALSDGAVDLFYGLKQAWGNNIDQKTFNSVVAALSGLKTVEFLGRGIGRRFRRQDSQSVPAASGANAPEVVDGQFRMLSPEEQPKTTQTGGGTNP